MAAEEVVHQDRSVGGAGVLGSDLYEATRMAVSYGMGDSPRFEIDYRRVHESYRPPADLRPAIDRVLQEEWRRAKEVLISHKDRLTHLAWKLVSERQMEISAS